jgi:hypothetical protein
MVLGFVLILNISEAKACFCTGPNLDANYIKATPYIAFIRIKSILQQLPKLDSNDYSPLFQITIEELTLFKGDSQKTINVSGGNEKFGTTTSCAMAIHEGQEWVVFCYVVDGKPVLSSCSNSVLYRENNGFRNRGFGGGISQLNFLNNYFKIVQPVKNINDGLYTEHFTNGNPEFSIPYKNNKKDGQAKYYYPDGKLYGIVNYKKDSLNGTALWYYESGALESRAQYKNGINVDTSAYFMQTGVPFMVSVYSKKGVIKKSLFYQGSDDNHLYTETFFDKGAQYKIIFYRQTDNTIETISYDKPDGGLMEENYDSTGKKTRTRHFDKNHKLVNTITYSK